MVGWENGKCADSEVFGIQPVVLTAGSDSEDSWVAHIVWGYMVCSRHWSLEFGSRGQPEILDAALAGH